MEAYICLKLTHREASKLLERLRFEEDDRLLVEIKEELGRVLDVDPYG